MIISVFLFLDRFQVVKLYLRKEKMLIMNATLKVSLTSPTLKYFKVKLLYPTAPQTRYLDIFLFLERGQEKSKHICQRSPKPCFKQSHVLLQLSLARIYFCTIYIIWLYFTTYLSVYCAATLRISEADSGAASRGTVGREMLPRRGLSSMNFPSGSELV